MHGLSAAVGCSVAVHDQFGLKGEVGGKSYREVTDKVLNNKFVIVRAEL